MLYISVTQNLPSGSNTSNANKFPDKIQKEEANMWKQLNQANCTLHAEINIVQISFYCLVTNGGSITGLGKILK